MRIGIDASKLMPPRDGIGSYTLGLLRGLAAAGAEHELLLYGSLHPIDPAVLAATLPDATVPDATVPDATVPDATVPDRPPSFRLAEGRWPTTGEVDLFHATTLSYPAGFAGPVVLTCHDLTFLTHPATHTVENRLHCLQGLLEALLGGAAFLAVSQATRTQLERWLEIAPPRVRVIYEAADPRFQPLPDAVAAARVRERFGIETPYLLAVGTLEPRKNLGRLLDAYGALTSRKRQTLPLLIAGAQGWDGGALARRVASTPELAAVRLLGHVADDDLPALYRSARALVYPSLAEGFGLPVLEAMACGTPVVASNATSLPEVVGTAGRLLDPLDTTAWTAVLAELAATPEVPAAERAAALAQAARFSWKKTARETLELYQSLL